MKKVFLDDLPKRWGKTNQVDWVKCAELRCKVKGIYDGIEFELEILDYDGKHLYIKYQDKNVFKILTYGLQKCRFGKLLNKHTDEFKIKIGQTFKDDKRDIVITNRENKKDKNGQNWKYYKYKCNKCGFECGEHYSVKDSEYRKELWISEGNLIKGQGCSCCNNKVVVEGINSIIETAPWMIPYFQNPDEAKIYAKSSNQKITPVCPDCGRIKDREISINSIYNKKSIGCTCSDSTPYPEKFMFSVLKQLGINFQTQLAKSTFEWCKDYRYDFYFNLNNNQYIIETHGLQHYKDTSGVYIKTLQEEVENDRLKKELALANGIKENNYIVIDCRKSDLEWIKNKIINSESMHIFNLLDIDWHKCGEFALSNRVKEACDLKKNNPNMTTGDIGDIMNLHCRTISGYLKRGTELGWCKYSTREKTRNNNEKMEKLISKPKGKQVEIFKNNISLGIFKSLMELERQSLKLFGVKLNNSNISEVCLDKKSNYKGYTFKHIDQNNKMK